MLLKSLQLTVRNFRGIVRIINTESFSNVQSQKYSRWVPRRPSGIVNEDELFDVNLDNTTPPKIRKSIKSQSATVRTNKTAKPKKSTVENSSENDFEETEEISFEIEDEKPAKPKSSRKTSKKNLKSSKESLEENSSTGLYTKLYDNDKVISKLMMNIKSKKNRTKHGQILLEGVRFIEDAMEAKLVPETIIFSRYEDIKHIKFNEKITALYKVPYRSIQLWSTLTTPPGVMGIFKKPPPLKISKFALPITVICDNVRDPGNMGSILRAAAGAGCEKVVTTKGCVDFWEPKVLRSAAGAHFRVPVFGSQTWDEIKLLINSDAHVYVADNNVESIENYDENEVDEDTIDEKQEDEETDTDDEKKKKHSKSKENKKKNKQELIVRYHNIPLVPYYSVDYAKNEVILIIGGETEGLSEESFRLIENTEGIRVNIPLHNGIDSLNAGMALGIIAFEVKRQFLQIQQKLNQLQQ